MKRPENVSGPVYEYEPHECVPKQGQGTLSPGPLLRAEPLEPINKVLIGGASRELHGRAPPSKPLMRIERRAVRGVQGAAPLALLSHTLNGPNP